MTNILNILHTCTNLQSLRMKGFNFKDRNLKNILILLPYLKEISVWDSWVSWITQFLTKEMQNFRVLIWMLWTRTGLFSFHLNSNRACICNAYWHWSVLLLMETFKKGPLYSIVLQQVSGTPHYTEAFVCAFLQYYHFPSF